MQAVQTIALGALVYAAAPLKAILVISVVVGVLYWLLSAGAETEA